MYWLKMVYSLRVFLLIILLPYSGAITNLQAQTEKRYLSGTGADDRVSWDFYCSKGMNSGKWTTIPVPSCWEQEGFGGYYYGYGNGDRLSETGTYRHQFQVPPQWKGKEISIVFEGVMTDAEVKINNVLAGPVHQGAFYEFSYDISSLVRYGKMNSLEVVVKKHSDNKSVNHAERDADYWVFGGIFRPVYLQIKPLENIQRVAIDANANGSIIADVYVSKQKNARSAKLEVFSPMGVSNYSVERELTGTVSRLTGLLANPSCWTPESPALYTAKISLLDANGKTVHSVEEKIGFRTVEIRESDGIYVNGVRVKLKGVNRHSFHPRFGRTSSKKLSVTAVNLMKDMNMNAVRMSHYPPDKHFLEVCDSLGLFVLNELAGWQKPTYDDTTGRKLIQEMVLRDQNHPSIILWDNGNEGGWNNSLNKEFAKWDLQKRQVIHPWEDYGLFNNYHYMDYNYLSNDGFNQRKIFMPTEFLHGLYDGGHGAGLEDYWLRMWNDPLCSGGFLWVFADEAVERSDRNQALDTYGNEAPDGIVGPYNEKEGSYYTIKELWSPIHFEKKYITPAFDGKMALQNRYHFTDLNKCSFTAEWVNCTGPAQPANETINHREIVSISLAPGQNGVLQLRLPDNWRQHDLLRVQAKDPFGRIIYTWTWPLQRANVKSEQLLSIAAINHRPILNETSTHFEVRSGLLFMKLRKENGQLDFVSKDGVQLPLHKGPVFVDNKKKIRSVHASFEDNNLVVEARFQKDDYFRWIIRGETQIIGLELAYEPERYSNFAGISFSYPEDQVESMRWLGNGPYRVYKNRTKGVSFGVWEKAYNNTVTGESGYQYPEFKGYHSNTYWFRLKNKHSPDFTVFVQSDDIYLKLFTPKEPAKPEKAAMVYPEGDLSFLHIINGIGDKFLEPEKLGPQSTPVLFNKERLQHGKLKLQLSFDFN